jgi:hypothetical protein
MTACDRLPADEEAAKSNGRNLFLAFFEEVRHFRSKKTKDTSFNYYNVKNFISYQ